MLSLVLVLELVNMFILEDTCMFVVLLDALLGMSLLLKTLEKYLLSSLLPLRTWNSQVFVTFKEACIARGLLENNHEWRICLEEAIVMQPGVAYCWLLTVILLTGKVAEPHVL